jgi:hypothetical protein
MTDLTIAAALTRYEQVAFKDLRPRTRRLYLALMKPLRKHLGDMRVSALSPFDLEKYGQRRTAPGRRGTGRTSTNRELGLLRTVIDRCKTWKLSTRTNNPCTAVKHFRESRGRERIVTYQEEDAAGEAPRAACHGGAPRAGQSVLALPAGARGRRDGPHAGRPSRVPAGPPDADHPGPAKCLTSQTGTRLRDAL